MVKEIKKVVITENAFNKKEAFFIKYFVDGSFLEFTLSTKGALDWAKNYKTDGVKVELYFS